MVKVSITRGICGADFKRFVRSLEFGFKVYDSWRIRGI